MATPTIAPVDMSSIGSSIMGTFNLNLPTILGLAGTFIAVALVLRWFRRSAK